MHVLNFVLNLFQTAHMILLDTALTEGKNRWLNNLGLLYTNLNVNFIL